MNKIYVVYHNSDVTHRTEVQYAGVTEEVAERHFNEEYQAGDIYMETWYDGSLYTLRSRQTGPDL